MPEKSIEEIFNQPDYKQGTILRMCRHVLCAFMRVQIFDGCL